MNTNTQIKYQTQNKRTSIAWKWYFLLLLIFCVPLIVLRTLQIEHSINLTNGYFLGNPISLYILYAGIILFFIIILLMAIVDRGMYQPHFEKTNSILIKVVSLATGIFSFIYPISNLYQAINNPDNTMPFILLVSILALLSGIGFIYFMWRIDKPNGGVSDILLGFPSLFCGILLLSMFMEHTVVVTISENVMNIIRVVFEALFFITAAKIVIHFDSALNQCWMIVSGFMSVLLGSLTTIPLCIGMLSGNVYTSEHLLLTTPLDCMLWIFTVVFLFYYFITRQPKQKERE